MASLAPNFISDADDASSRGRPRGALESCAAHDHLCLIYDTQQEQLAAAIPFLRIGLERGEKCVYVTGENTSDTIREAMREVGVAVDRATASGALTILTCDEAYLKNGGFDPEWMIGFLREEVEAAEARGFTSFRITGETGWALRSPQSIDPLIEYECRLNDVFPSHNVLAVCQYNREHFRPEALLHVLQMHPFVVHGGLICDNPHYIPPESFRKESHDPAAQLQRFLDGIVQNTQLKQRLAAETDALRESERKFRTIVDTTPECVKLVAADGTLLHINPPGLAMIGARSAGEVLGKSFYSLIADEDREAFRAFNERVCRGDKGSLRFDIVNLQGARRHLESHAAPLRTPDGHTVQLAVTHDITERKLAEESLRATEERLKTDLEDTLRLQSVSTAISSEENIQALYDKVLDSAVAIMRSDFGTIQILYPERGRAGELRLLASRGLTPEGAAYWGWVGPDTLSTCGIALNSRTRVVVPDIAQCASIEGSEEQSMLLQAGIHAAQSTPLVSRDGKLLGMITTHWLTPHQPSERDFRMLDILARQAADLIERKLAEDRQRQSEAALRKSEKFAAAGRMAATVAHEINNPLESVMNLCYLLGDENLPPAARNLLQTLDVELDRVARITRQTLAFYREGKTAAPLDLGESIRAAVTLFTRKAEQQGASIQASFRTSASVYGFSGELRQVFANLLSNSLEAGATAIKIRVSPTFSPSISTSPARAGVSILVADNGSGISTAAARKVFQPFFTTKEEKGTGLGLWVSKGIMQKHEGSLRMRTSVEPSRHGTTFRVFLPTLEARA